MGRNKGKQVAVDISPFIEGAVSCGVAVACALVGLNRADILRRFDRDAAFRAKTVRLISESMGKSVFTQRDLAGDAAVFKALVDEIIAEAGRLVARG